MKDFEIVKGPEMEFDNPRERAIYDLGKEAGKTTEKLNDNLQQAVFGTIVFIALTAFAFLKGRNIKNSSNEELIHEKMLTYDDYTEAEVVDVDSE